MKILNIACIVFGISIGFFLSQLSSMNASDAREEKKQKANDERARNSTSNDQLTHSVTADELTILLGMQVWKTRVDDAKTLTFYSKKQGSGPKEILKLETHGEGVAMLSLRDLPNDQIEATLVFRAHPKFENDITSPSMTAIFENPVSSVGSTTNLTARFGASKTTVLISGSNFSVHRNNVSDADSQAIYMTCI